MRSWSDWHALSLLQLHCCDRTAQTVVDVAAVGCSDDQSTPYSSFVATDLVAVVVVAAAAAVDVVVADVVIAAAAVAVAVVAEVADVVAAAVAAASMA